MDRVEFFLKAQISITKKYRQFPQLRAQKNRLSKAITGSPLFWGSGGSGVENEYDDGLKWAPNVGKYILRKNDNAVHHRFHGTVSRALEEQCRAAMARMKALLPGNI